MTVDNRSQKCNIECKERDTSGEFDRLGLGVANKHCLEHVVQIGPEPGKGSVMDSECMLDTGDNSVKYFFISVKGKTWVPCMNNKQKCT